MTPRIWGLPPGVTLADALSQVSAGLAEIHPGGLRPEAEQAERARWEGWDVAALRPELAEAIEEEAQRSLLSLDGRRLVRPDVTYAGVALLLADLGRLAEAYELWPRSATPAQTSRPLPRLELLGDRPRVVDLRSALTGLPGEAAPGWSPMQVWELVEYTEQARVTSRAQHFAIGAWNASCEHPEIARYLVFGMMAAGFEVRTEWVRAAVENVGGADPSLTPAALEDLTEEVAVRVEGLRRAFLAEVDPPPGGPGVAPVGLLADCLATTGPVGVRLAEGVRKRGAGWSLWLSNPRTHNRDTCPLPWLVSLAWAVWADQQKGRAESANRRERAIVPKVSASIARDLARLLSPTTRVVGAGSQLELVRPGGIPFAITNGVERVLWTMKQIADRHGHLRGLVIRVGWLLLYKLAEEHAKIVRGERPSAESGIAQWPSGRAVCEELGISARRAGDVMVCILALSGLTMEGSDAGNLFAVQLEGKAGFVRELHRTGRIPKLGPDGEWHDGPGLRMSRGLSRYDSAEAGRRQRIAVTPGPTVLRALNFLESRDRWGCPIPRTLPPAPPGVNSRHAADYAAAGGALIVALGHGGPANRARRGAYASARARAARAGGALLDWSELADATPLSASQWGEWGEFLASEEGNYLVEVSRGRRRRGAWLYRDEDLAAALLSMFKSSAAASEAGRRGRAKKQARERRLLDSAGFPLDLGRGK